MSDRIRNRVLLGWAVMLMSAGVAACDSPIVAPYSTEGSRALEMVPATEAATPVATPVADTDTTLFYVGCGPLWNYCPPTGTVTVGEPGGNVAIGTFGSQWTETVTVGGSSYGFQLGIEGGSFIGVIWKNGVFAGYWGYCLFENAQNKSYKTTDPVTGKVYIHWENHEKDSTGVKTGQMYHYVYDPQTNTLKVYHRDSSGNTKLVYQGPPIKSNFKLPPPRPGPGDPDPFTNENQYPAGVPVPPVPPGSTTTAPPGTLTPGSPSGPSAVVGRDRHRSVGGSVMITTP